MFFYGRDIVIRIKIYFAVPPAVVMFPLMVDPALSVGVPFSEPAAKLAVPQVSAPVKIEVAPPPVRIGVTVGVPASAAQATAVMVAVAP